MPRVVKCLLLSAVLAGCESDPTTDTAAAGFEAGASVSQPTAGSLALETAPSDGNGNKLVLTFEDNFSADCPAGDVLDGHLEGWVQVRTSDQPDNPNVRLEVFHALITFSNAAGETYVFHDVGPNHYYVQNGILFIAISGHSSGGVIGRVVLNLDTGETVEFSAGHEFGSPIALACEALT